MVDNYISCQGEKGSINISEDVIIAVVKNTVNEVDGVAGLAVTAGADLAELLGIKTVSKGIKVQFVNDAIVIDTIILVNYGCNIVNVAKEVQETVKDAVQAATGIENAIVNVHISGVSFEK